MKCCRPPRTSQIPSSESSKPRDRDVDDLGEKALAPLVDEQHARGEALPDEPRRRDDLAERIDLELIPRAVADAHG